MQLTLDDVLAEDGKLISIKGEEVKKITHKNLLAFCCKHNISGYKGKNKETVCALILKKQEISNVIWSLYHCGTEASVAKTAVAGTAAAGTAAVGTDAVGTTAVGTAAVGTAAVGTATVGTAAVGTAAVRTAAVGTAAVGTAAVGTAAVGTAAVGTVTATTNAVTDGYVALAGTKKQGIYA